jgi:hypothetical protein
MPPRLSDDAFDAGRDGAIGTILAGRACPPLDFLDRFPHEWPTVGGSPNIAAEKNALRLYRQETLERALKAWEWQAQRSKSAFEDIEPGSRIYRSRTLRAHLLALRWASAPSSPAWLRDFLRDWLRLYWALELLACVDRPFGPQSMRCGARSAGHALEPLQGDYALSLELGLPFRWQKPWKFKGPQNKAPEGELARQLRALCPSETMDDEVTIAIDTADGKSNDLLAGAMESLPKWGTLAPTHYYRTSQGVAVWVENQEGGNTVGISAMGCDGGGEPWCIGPSPAVWAGKERPWRQKPYRLWCEQPPLDDGILQAGGEVAGGLLPIETHPLPADEVLYHVRHGEVGLELLA